MLIFYSNLHEFSTVFLCFRSGGSIMSRNNYDLLSSAGIQSELERLCEPYGISIIWSEKFLADAKTDIVRICANKHGHYSDRHGQETIS